MELDNSEMFDNEKRQKELEFKAKIAEEKLRVFNEVKLQQKMFEQRVEEGRQASEYNSIMENFIHEDNFFNELSKIPQSQLSGTDKLSKIEDIKNFLDKNLLSKVKNSLNASKIGQYIVFIHQLTENCYKDDIKSIFETKIKAYSSLLDCKNITTNELNIMVHLLVSTSIYDKRRYSQSSFSVLDKSSEEGLNKIFSHHLFSNNNNAPQIPLSYEKLIKNITNPKRTFRINFRETSKKLTNKNYQNYLSNSRMESILNQFKNENMIFDCFLKNNIKYLENYLIDKKNPLTYLVDNTKGLFAYQELVDTYLKKSLKLIDSLDNQLKTPVEYAKKNANFFFYESNPIYKVLIKHGAKPIKNHSLDLIKSGINTFKSKPQESLITYQKTEKTKNETELMHETMLDNIKTIKVSLNTLKLKDEEKIFFMLDNILKLSMELTTESNKTNINEKYLFIKKSTLEYLPNFTHDFLQGLNLAPSQEKPLFIEEYSKQIDLFHQKVIDNYEFIIKHESDNKLDVMKKNTAFLTSKM